MPDGESPIYTPILPHTAWLDQGKAARPNEMVVGKVEVYRLECIADRRAKTWLQLSDKNILGRRTMQAYRECYDPIG